MKTLELNEMENFQGGQELGDVKTGIAVACIGIGVLSIAGSIFTFGASLAFGVTIGGAFCTGAAAGQFAYDYFN